MIRLISAIAIGFLIYMLQGNLRAEKDMMVALDIVGIMAWTMIWVKNWLSN